MPFLYSTISVLLCLPKRITCTFCLALLLISPSLQASIAPDTTRIQELLDESWEIMYQNPDSALQLSKRALKLSQGGKFKEWEADCRNRLGVVYWVRSEYETALRELEAAREMFTELGDSAGMGSASNNLGITYMAMSYFDLAMEAFQDALPQVEREDKPDRLATLFNNLGWVAQATGDFDASQSYFDRAFAIVQQLPDPSDTAMIHNNLAMLHRSRQDFLGAHLHHQRAVSGFRQQENPPSLIQALFNFGGNWALRDSFDRAKGLYAEALSMAREYGNPKLLGSVWIKMGELAERRGDHAAAITAGDSAAAYYAGGPELDPQRAISELLALAHAGVGDYESALYHSKRVRAYNDSLLNTDKMRTIAELTLKYESELKDKEIEVLREREALGRWQKGALAGLAGMVFLGALLVVRRQRAIIQREKALQEKAREAAAAQEALSRAELKAAALERERLEADVQHKSKEISNLAMGIIRHHELLQALDQNLQAIRKKANPEVKSEIQELAVLVVGEMGAEKERQDLQLYIEEAEQRFFQALDEGYPNLTQRERRLCALVRMGYSSKQIAALFNINPNSVDMGRYRLRKKLDPDMEVPLQEFLERLSPKNEKSITN